MGRLRRGAGAAAAGSLGGRVRGVSADAADVLRRTGQGWTAWWAARQQDLGMRGLCTDRTATVIIAGRAFVQNLRRGNYELALDAPPALRVATAFTELAQAI
jgi:hypothetical protein